MSSVWRALAAGMVLAVDALEVLHRDVRVDLRGGDVGVAEQALDTAQVGAVLDHVSGATVAQHVRTGFVRAAFDVGLKRRAPSPKPIGE